MNDQAETWVWGYADAVRNFCKKYFPRDPQILEDMTHNILLRISQRDGLDQVGDRSKWMRTVALHECMDCFRELKRNRDRAMVADEISSTLEDVENETDESEKIDPVKVWHSFKRLDPENAKALIRSYSFVRQVFPWIKWHRDAIKGLDQDAKLVATLQDAKRQMEKIHGICTDQDIQKYADSIETGHVCEHTFEVELQYHLKELILSLSIEGLLTELGITNATASGANKPHYNFHRGSIDLDFFDSFEYERILKDGEMEAHIHYYRLRMRILDYVHIPDPLYVLYGVWNRILKKGKYGNRKLLEVLFFAFQKLSQEHMKDDTVESFHDDTFNSLTEETNFETVRVMSYQLNKGYSDLADFIFRKSVHPPKKKTPSTRPH